MALRLHPGLENVTSLSSLHSDADKTKRRVQSFKKSPLWGLASFIDAFILLFPYFLSYNCFTLSLYWVQTNWGAFTSLRNLIPSAFWRCSHSVQILLLQETLSALHRLWRRCLIYTDLFEGMASCLSLPFRPFPPDVKVPPYPQASPVLSFHSMSFEYHMVYYIIIHYLSSFSHLIFVILIFPIRIVFLEGKGFWIAPRHPGQPWRNNRPPTIPSLSL